MEKFILSIDQGTTSSRAILFDKLGHERYSAYREVKCLFPKSGWVEQDALSLWVSVIDVINEVLVKANINFSSIDSIGISNQRETTVIWDKETGMPIYNAIVWQSRQTSYICDRYSKYKDLIHEKTGLLINPYFSASKIRFILDNVQNGQERAEKGELMCGTIDTWLVYRLTKGETYATDVSNASRTMLYNINTLEWDEELLSLFNIPKCILPEVKPSSCDYGAASFFSKDVHIRGVAGDQQAALFGHTCFKKGDSKNTYGTGCFMLMNTGDTPIYSKKGLLTTIAWQIGDKVTYAIEGSVFIGGAVVQWLRDQMRMIDYAAQSEDEALKSSSTHGVYIVPAFVGLGTPYWDDNARGAVFGLTRGSNKSHFIRAALDSIDYQCKDVFDVMVKETGNHISSLKVDGGATQNNYLMQFQADILSTTIEVAKCHEITALGVCYLAGLNSGFYTSLQAVSEIHENEKVFPPKMSKKEINTLCKGWKAAVKATRAFKPEG